MSHRTACRFSPDPAAATTQDGAEGQVLYFNGKLYDNVFSRRRGVTALSWPKPKIKFELPDNVRGVARPVLLALRPRSLFHYGARLLHAFVSASLTPKVAKATSGRPARISLVIESEGRPTMTVCMFRHA